MSLTALALRDTIWLSALQSGRGTAEGLFVLFLLAAVTSVLAYRGIGGQLMRLANLVLILLFVVGIVFVLL
ncbi:hypothetical protein [Haloarcula salinisoli]|uniref:Uncharacterized protein n=1 Tax=Haloarcula salinisoli TaxID=2487746 RepID=A0A8J7YKN0_9EURY|nr:hypothetical protein [Halomicroarcula salinisoli]MBX0287355.1 hypothetical protein [Halomicroarcula salinisoli]MBX0305071.1 hypothetical protein [Halomicroarcula salinisoli]